MAMTAEAIIFAINSAIRLGRNAQRAYSLSLSSKAIVLPLPKFSGTPNAFTAQRFFDSEEADGGARFIARIEGLQAIHQRFKSAAGEAFPTDEELEKYVESFVSLSALQEQEANPDFKDGLNDNRINSDELVALLSIRQYTFDGAKHTSPLQLVAGTIVEIGIDYFHKIPGALNQQSATGRTLQHFLKAFDDLPLSDNAKLQAQSRKIVPQLFIAAAETLTDFSSHVINDPKIQSFVQAAGSGIAQDLNTRLLEISDDDNQDEAIKWGRFLLRSTIANSGHYVFAAPDQFFKTNSGASALITATSTVLLDAILKDPDQLNIKAGLNADTLDRLLQSSFAVLAEHPQLIHHKNGFQEVVTGVSSALKDYNFRRPDLFPELVRLVLENTGKHLHLFWQGGDDHDGGGHGHDDDHRSHHAREAQGLLIQAVQMILQELSQPVDAGNWRPRLSKSQLLFITEEMLDKVVNNPDWVTREVGGKPLLAAVVRATVDGLAHIPREERLSADSFRQLLELNLRTVAANELVLQKIKWSEDGPEEAVLQQALSLVFAFVFDRQRTTAGDRYTLLADLLDYVLDVIISRHPDHRGLLLVDLVLFSGPQLNYAGGFNRQLANSLLDAALDTLAAHPDLISKDKALGEIVAGVASALDASSFKESNIMVELVRLSLEKTALNAGLIVRTAAGDPNFLLVTFIRELLLAISHQEDANGAWQPDLTPAEALVIVDNLVSELILHPEWIIEGPDGQVVFRDVMGAVRNAMGNLPAGVRLTTTQLEYLLAIALQSAATSAAVLDKIPWGSDLEKRSVLERAMDLVATFVFQEMTATGGERLERFAALIEYVMEVILAYHPNQRGLLLVQLILFGEGDVDYSRGFDEALSTSLMESALRVLEQHSDLVSGEKAVQAIVSDLAASLEANDLRQKGILPELVRLSLEATAQNAQLLVNTAPGEAKFLVVLALQDLLTQLSTKGVDGQWRPRLTADDLLVLSENLLDEVVQHPHWLLAPDPAQPSLWQQVMKASLDALASLPVGTRLAPSVLENLLLLSLNTAANSPRVLEKITWATDDQEQMLLNRVLNILIGHVYPTGATASAERLERFLELLDFVLEVVMSQYPDRRSLLILDLLFFESEVDLSQGFQRSVAEDLVDAALSIAASHPDLLTQELVFRKIISDTASALRAARTPLQHLLPEFIRLTLSYATGHLEALMRISTNSPRILLAVALEQVLRVVTAPPSRGSWRPQLTDDQLLVIVQNVMERVVARPDWVGNDKLIQVTLEAIYTALGELRRDQPLPFETVNLLVQAGLDAVGQRKTLVLHIVTASGNRQQLVLEYALGSLLVELYDTQQGTAGSWTLTDAETFRTLLSHYLLRLAVGPADQQTVDAIRQPIADAIKQINDNLAFSLEELIGEVGKV